MIVQGIQDMATQDKTETNEPNCDSDDPAVHQGEIIRHD